MRQARLFGLSDQLRRLSDFGCPLETTGWVVKFKVFRPALEKAPAYCDGAKATTRRYTLVTLVTMVTLVTLVGDNPFSKD